jgi:Skp family chaperone for outer membrane proteins
VHQVGYNKFIDIMMHGQRNIKILKVQLSQEGEKLAAILTERFEAAKTKFREEFNGKLQQEFQGVSGKVDKLERDTEHDIDNLTKSVGNLSVEVNSSVNAHIEQTRKELYKQGNNNKLFQSYIIKH